MAFLVSKSPQVASLDLGKTGLHGSDLKHAAGASADVVAELASEEMVQMHLTGFVKPDDADAKFKFLATEALRCVGGIVLNKDGQRLTQWSREPGANYVFIFLPCRDVLRDSAVAHH